MPTSLTDLLPPNTQLIAGISMACAALPLWLAGIKIARAALAILLGAALATLAVLFLPPLIDLSPISSGILGFVAGSLAGSLGFRVLQGLALGLCLGLVVALAYYAHLPAPSQATTLQSLQIPLDELPATTEAASNHTDPAAIASSFQHFIADRWSHIPPKDQHTVELLSAAVAIVVILIALAYPRHTTWTLTALLGAFLLLAGLDILRRLYAPRFTVLPDAPAARILIHLTLAIIGMAVQRYLFWPRIKRKPQTVTPVPAKPMSPTEPSKTPAAPTDSTAPTPPPPNPHP